MFTIPSLPFTFPYFSEISWRHWNANPGPFALWLATLTTNLSPRTPPPMYFLRWRLSAMADLCDSEPEPTVRR